MRTGQGRPVEGVVDRLSERSLAGSLERGPIGVEPEDGLVRVGIPSGMTCRFRPYVRRGRGRPRPESRTAARSRSRPARSLESLARVGLDRPDDSVGIGGAPTAVVGIPFQDDVPVRVALREVVRPRSRRIVDRLGSASRARSGRSTASSGERRSRRWSASGGCGGGRDRAPRRPRSCSPFPAWLRRRRRSPA